ncbi:hypothetical protein CIG75_18900 [Tumebacillus algifaecis]|uniref:Uncharacterized protein n=1 Tax=Tumebacillus algifaecis TaxID=1214604 RepID=A0A223D602_9BACL|nr:hypothetical protein [Tumebacillus algifaecis]ASS76804.1 hypothetical protein CIG75_18900 [Tumebacillus algifaecis]
MKFIGRKIYYEITTGNVILDTGERAGDVVETTVGQDFAAYMALAERVPESVGVIQFAFGEHAENFSRYPYRIDPATEAILWGVDSTGVDLDQLKVAKIAQLEDFYKQSIESGFTSTALGDEHIYPSNDQAQRDLQIVIKRLEIAESDARAADIDLTDPDNLPTFAYLTLDSGPLPHTLAQLNRVFADGVDAAVPALDRFRTLREAVLACETIDEVQQIDWNETLITTTTTSWSVIRTNTEGA